jgi:hypothetical protein
MCVCSFTCGLHSLHWTGAHGTPVYSRLAAAPPRAARPTRLGERGARRRASKPRAAPGGCAPGERLCVHKGFLLRWGVCSRRV